MHRVQVTQLFANHEAASCIVSTISVERVSALRSSQVESRQTRQKGHVACCAAVPAAAAAAVERGLQSSSAMTKTKPMPCHNIMPLSVISLGMIAAHSNLFPLLFVMAQPPSSSSSSTTATPAPTESLQTLAPFALTVSGPPTSPSISSSATTPTVSPTDGPTSLPSYSKFPSVIPSVSPTAYPTISSHPTALPSTSSLPTLAASEFPSISPVYAPSSTPSTETYVSVHRSFQQILQVEAAEVFTDVQHKIYQLLMQSYTANFGHMVSEPLIVTTAIITDQSLAAGRRKRRNGRRRRLNQQRTSSRIRQLLFENATEGTLSSSSTNTSELNLPHLLRQFEPIPIHLLVISFNMKYTTKFGFDTMEEYPAQFQNYINSNLANVTVDMSMRFLPVLEARSVLMYLPVSTGLPSPNPSSLSPQYYWNGQPTEQPPSVLVPTTMAPYPSSSPIIKEKANFVVGLAVGLVLAAIIVVGVFIGYKIIKKRRKEEQRRLLQQQQPIADEEMRHDFRGRGERGNELLDRNPSWRIEEGVEVRAEDVMLLPGETEEMTSTPSGGKASSDPFVASNEQQQYHHHHQQQQQQQQLQLQSPQQHLVENSILESTSNNNDASSTQTFIPHDAIADSMLSNPSMVSGGGSFSSNPDDYPDGMFGGGGGGGGIGSHDVRVDTLQDEFDNYKNHDLEHMRSGVEETVYGAESMMSLAMTRALMGEEDVDAHPSWVEAEGDPESMEANGLCETNDWLRKNEHSTLDERNQFFQELLNRMVITVRRGLLSPANGTLTIHCCAAMLGLQLEKELPNNVLLVHGMRKANDLALGRVYLIEAFNTFGEIESAAIAPSNRGFGFVRFVSPKSVQRALEQFRISEIEVQDVSVMIKSLNDFSPAYD